jgi:hypothetical protein
MKLQTSTLLSALLLAALSGCTVVTPSIPGVPGQVNVNRTPEIPPGHMPPPGECRIWYYDREPGQQPPPGKCERLKHQVPSNAVLIRG